MLLVDIVEYSQSTESSECNPNSILPTTITIILLVLSSILSIIVIIAGATEAHKKSVAKNLAKYVKNKNTNGDVTNSTKIDDTDENIAITTAKHENNMNKHDENESKDLEPENGKSKCLRRVFFFFDRIRVFCIGANFFSFFFVVVAINFATKNVISLHNNKIND